MKRFGDEDYKFCVTVKAEDKDKCNSCVEGSTMIRPSGGRIGQLYPSLVAVVDTGAGWMNRFGVNPIQVVSIWLFIFFIIGEAMAQNGPRPPELAPDIRIIGNKSALKKEDARFIDFTGRIKPEDIYSFIFKPLRSDYHYETEKGRIQLRVDDHVLVKIDYEVISNPLATESTTKTFWKTESNLYFFMFTGGLAVTTRLFGPFRIKGDTFVFIGKA